MRIFLSIILLLIITPATAQTLERGNGPEPSTLDAHKCPEVACGNILRDLYEGLISKNGEGKLIPGMAERWEVSNDGRVWTFHLREQLKWSNGEALTADDIVRSFQRAFTPITASPFAEHFEAIENVGEIMRGEKPPSQLGVSSPEPHIIEIKLKRSAALLQLLTLPTAYPVYLPGVKNFSAQHTRPGNLVSNGAYRLQAWTPQSFVKLERNPHFRELANIPNVRYHVTEDASSELKRFESGGLHITETLPPQPLLALKQKYGGQLRISPYLGSFWFGFNLTQAPLKNNRALREALSLSIDREKLTRYITGFGEHAAYAVVPPGTADYSSVALNWSKLTQSQRESLARKKLLAAGYDKNKPLEIELRYNTSTPHRRLSLAVAAMWRDVLGIKVRLRNEEWKVFVSNRKQKVITQVFRGGWIADVNDPRNFLSNFQSGNVVNWSGLNDKRFDALMQQADEAGSPQQRAALMQQAEIKLLSEHAVMPVYFYVSKHLVNPQVTGYEANLLDHHPSRFLRLQEIKR
ncbi:MAG: peptide ABC transporter substrate-binding protein [Arenimonas sp.]